jgi:hypothetical protein
MYNNNTNNKMHFSKIMLYFMISSTLRNFLDPSIEYTLPLTTLFIPMQILYLGFETWRGHHKSKYTFTQGVFFLFILYKYDVTLDGVRIINLFIRCASGTCLAQCTDWIIKWHFEILCAPQKQNLSRTQRDTNMNLGSSSTKISDLFCSILTKKLVHRFH